MPLLRAESEKLSNNILLAGVVEELLYKDALFALLPFMHINTKEFSWIQEDESAMSTAVTGTASVDWLDPYDTVPEAGMSFVEKSAKLRILAGQVQVDNFLQATMGDTNNQLAVQLAAKAKVIRSKFQRNFAIGNATTTPLQFDGLPQLVTAGQTVYAGTNGAALTFDLVDELVDKVNYGADAIIMHSKTWRAVKAMMRALNIAPEHIAMADVGISVPALNGIPVVINDFLSLTEERGSSGAVCTSIYAARFNEADGLTGLWGGPTLLQVESLGTSQTKDATMTRLKLYASVALLSTKSLARIAGIKLS